MFGRVKNYVEFWWEKSVAIKCLWDAGVSGKQYKNGQLSLFHGQQKSFIDDSTGMIGAWDVAECCWWAAAGISKDWIWIL